MAKNSGSGELYWAGPPLYIAGSDTYHMSTLIATYDYVLFSGDTDFLSANWAKYSKAMDYIIAKIDSSGMLSITGSANWGRAIKSDGRTTDGNALMYRTLSKAATLAHWIKQDTTAARYEGLAATLKSALAQNNWDPNIGCVYPFESYT